MRAVFAAGLATAALAQFGKKPIGGEKDDKGCLKSGGYTYCAALDDCVRPWELLENEEYEGMEFEDICEGDDSESSDDSSGGGDSDSSEVSKESEEERKPVGGEKDDHGCIGAAGYSWCEGMNTCVRSWEVEDFETQCLGKKKCGEVMCMLWCEHGNLKDYDGCDICKCAEKPQDKVCPKIRCANQCRGGFQKDDKGCPTCKCNC